MIALTHTRMHTGTHVPTTYMHAHMYIHTPVVNVVLISLDEGHQLS